jgi:prevent-host-death family protein
MTGDIGIRELKSRLSEVLDQVASGHRVRITDRGTPKAMIVPLPGVNHLQTGIRDGWISVGPAFGKPLPPPPANLPEPAPGVTTMGLLDEDRGL